MEMNTEKIDYTRHYKKWHSDTPEHIQAMKHYSQGLLIPFLPTNKEISILEVGCGMGFAMLALQDLGYINHEGIDIDYGQVQSCLQKGLNVTQVKDSTAYLNSHKNQYDLIIALDVIEHIPQEGQLDFVKGMCKALKPDGQIICTVPNANSGLASRWRYIDWTHYLSFTEHSLDFLLYNAGFQSIEVVPTEFFHPPNFRLFFSRSIFRSWFWKSILQWTIFRFIRGFRRLEMIGELGWEQGISVPLSLNLLARGSKQP
ncbi:class I SAM-dependent methyltransferase [Nostoc parmelioides]|uniref:Class I SAM-dependent methyltransferase n=1 Tax=Nostoc parmelioides FACHB-3921 TaxID=2692909 RepID=A0ABR8BP22_9NOSO|nr:class I SAM-dependent methyltransferase [Nostoc parmelioides]MBD2254576.1 class I SAM-dependent methyltransferase [Nostoc parmelioides FACHB-3921]